MPPFMFADNLFIRQLLITFKQLYLSHSLVRCHCDPSLRYSIRYLIHFAVERSIESQQQQPIKADGHHHLRKELNFFGS